MRRKIPSTKALLAFDAAARHQSFTHAAAELAVTEGAISRQIATLEDSLGILLFDRVKKRVTLTQAGLLYAEQVKQILERIERDTLQIMAHEGRGGIIELAVLPTFASQWLLPRLGSFNARHPEITINMSARASVFLFPGTPFDAAIHYGEPTWPGTEAHYLFNEESIPVCRPDLLRKKRGITAQMLSDYPLLHAATRPSDWQHWFAAAGVTGINAMKGSRFELHSMLISAACAGLGIALLPRFLVAPMLASGALMVPVNQPLRSDKAYYLVCPEGKQTHRPIVLFRQWLLAQAAAFRDLR